jgi:hypothetical protein
VGAGAHDFAARTARCTADAPQAATASRRKRGRGSSTSPW